MDDFLKTQPPKIQTNASIKVREEDYPYQLHISKDWKIKEFIPAISRRQADLEDRTIPRICAADTLLGAMIGYNAVSYEFWYQGELDKDQAKNYYRGGYYIYGIGYDACLCPNKKLVYDASESGETWLVNYKKNTAIYTADKLGKFFVKSISRTETNGKVLMECDIYLEVFPGKDGKDIKIKITDTQTVQTGYYLLKGSIPERVKNYKGKPYQIMPVPKKTYTDIKNKTVALLNFQEPESVGQTMINLSAYQTTACKGYLVDKIANSLMITRTNFEYDNPIKNSPLAAITAKASIDNSSSIYSNISTFSHPLIIGDNENRVTFVDLRPFTKIDMRSQECIISNRAEYSFMVLRGNLQIAFYTDNGRVYLRDTSPTLMQIYATWISENISRRFSLDAGAQYRLYIFSAVFYQSLFMSGELGDRDVEAMVLRITRDLRVKAEDVFDVIDQVGLTTDGNEPLIMMTLPKFCEYLPKVTGSVRLDNFSPAILFTLVGGTWLGYNAREVACVALEHIPTFIAMVYASANNRSFSVSNFSKLTLRFLKREKNDLPVKIVRILDTVFNS